MRRTLTAGLAIAATAAIPASAHAAAQYIYWGDSVNSGIGRTAADGSGTPQANFVAAGTAVQPAFLTISGNWLYWARPNGVGRVQLTGTGATNSFVTTGFTTTAGITSDATYVYFLTQPTLSSNNVARAPIAGGPANTSFAALSNWEPTGIVLVGGDLYWNQSVMSPNAADIATVPATGTGLVTPNWSTGASGARGIASDGTYIYWADDLNRRIGRVAIASPGSPNPNFITNAATSGIKGIAVDDEYIYWVNQVSQANDKIGRARLDGSVNSVDPSFISLPGEAYGVAAGTPSAATHVLTVTRDGDGSGTVASAPSGINCGPTCTAPFVSGATVSLTATAAAGSTFAGWGGACAGSATPTCSVQMSQARSATATFSVTTSAGTAAGGSSGGSSSTPASTDPNSFTVRAGTVRGRGITTRVTVPGAGRILQRGTRLATTRATTAAAARRVTACTGSRAATKAGSLTITCRLTAATQAARRRGPVAVRVATTFSPADGARRTAVRTVVLPRIAVRPTVVVG